MNLFSESQLKRNCDSSWNKCKKVFMAVSIRIECEQVFNDANGLWIYAKKGEEIPNLI